MQHHGAALRAITQEEEWVAALAADWRRAELEPRLRAILTYAEKLTRSPERMRREDVEALRSAGLTDEAVPHACEVVAYYNFVNRMADGLGVTLEPDWPQELLEGDGRSGRPRGGDPPDSTEEGRS